MVGDGGEVDGPLGISVTGSGLFVACGLLGVSVTGISLSLGSSKEEGSNEGADETDYGYTQESTGYEEPATGYGYAKRSIDFAPIAHHLAAAHQKYEEE
jgi:hypothetical protein